MADETLQMLADAVAAFAVPDGKRVRALSMHPAGYDRAVWLCMGKQGWFSIFVPQEQGGLGLGVQEAAVIARRLGYALYPEPFVASGVFAVSCLSGSGNAGIKNKVLPAMQTGEMVVAVAWQPATGGLSLNGTSVQVRIEGEVVILDGEARFVAVCDADAFIVAARGEGGLGLYWIKAGATGITVRSEPCADGTSSAWVSFDSVRVEAADCIAEPGRGCVLLQRALDDALVAASAELVGIAERVLEMTLDYLRQRKQFGKAIGSFQALQHRAVDMWIQKEVALSSTMAAAAVLDDPGATSTMRSRAASGAKMRASQAAGLVCREAVQLHGAMGTTGEYDLSLYLNRTLVLTAGLGNASAHRRRYDQFKEC